MRTHEVLDILEVAGMILNACLMRRSSSRPLCFERTDTALIDPEEDRRYITIRQENGVITEGSVSLDYYGDLKENYEKHNGEVSHE